MSRVSTTIAAALAVVALAGAAPAQPASTVRTIEQYTCKDVMALEGTNREVAIAFLHGFLLGKSGTSTFDIDKLHAQSGAFVDQCLDNPKARAVDIMMKLKG